MTNPYQPPRATLSAPANHRGLACPACAVAYELTWPRYLRAPFGRHRCPECGTTFRAVHTRRYYVVLVAALPLVAAVSGGVMWLSGSLWLTGLVYALALTALVVVDRQLDANLLQDIEIRRR